ncbi:glutamine synthetase [candidate division TA06 bacterium DG_26]|uniref:Glutamine synthetase n=1 Tax=candidate division TA06 bacterium DG_26 TaxID=1703771 RepID=A0A0S7WMC5_UNCT6|nr:MAG: glutamine synthetase [candidate division TA06 bacterium DG_26]
MTYPKEEKEILQFVKEKRIKVVRLWFTDILGQLKGFAITSDQLEEAFSEGMGFDGSSIEGFVRIYESDLLAKPDPKTFALLPWDVEGEPTARMFCDVYTSDGKEYEGDPRYVLKRNLRLAEDMGYSYYVGPELEYFYLRAPDSPTILDEGGYFDVTPVNIGTKLRKRSIFALEQIGIQVEYSHHEVSFSQHEIDLKFQDALTMADFTMTYRLVVKEIAREEGVYATFMPKPIFGINGSGMHIHQSLFKKGRNAFYDRSDQYCLSSAAKHFIAGLLTHAVEITSITNQWVNSYKRLVVGYEAPVYITWGRMNRSALVRVPNYKPGKEQSTRVEYRAPDPGCNPYLAFACMLRAGLRGIEKEYPLPEPFEEDIYAMSEADRRRRAIQSLPDNLYAAIQETERSDLVKETLGPSLFDKFIANRKREWEEYRIQVTDYELKRYLPIL